jgi:hypothetical protein
MEDDTIQISIPLDNDHRATLRFRANVYRRHVAEARAEGCALSEYLARRVFASGIGDNTLGMIEEEAVLADLLTK